MQALQAKVKCGKHKVHHNKLNNTKAIFRHLEKVKRQKLLENETNININEI